MNSLLVGVDLGRAADAILERSCRITEALMPKLGSQIREFRRSFPELGGGWFYFLPDPSLPRPLVSDSCSSSLAVLAYGETDSAAAARSPAEEIRAAWQRGGASAVREIDGSFSAVLVDRDAREIHVISDPVGRRTLRYWSRGGSLLVSTHDLPIVATGLCPLDFDLVSAASIVGCDWSLSGTPLLRGVEACPAHEIVRWRGPSVERIEDWRFAPAQRIEARDADRLAEQLMRMVDLLVGSVRTRCRGATRIYADLTAGLDTRAALAALLASVEPERILARTAGGAEHIDVQVAREIATRCGVRHERLETSAPSSDDFFENCDVLAFYRNGDANGKRSFGEPPRYSPEAPLVISGGGGEIFRGYYYDPTKIDDSLGDPASVTAALRSHLSRLTRLSWSDPEILRGIERRLDSIVGRLMRCTGSASDALDCFYLLERFSHWALGARMPQEDRRYFAFECTALFRAAFELPRPIARHCPLHRELIRTHLEPVYWMPVNGSTLLPLDELSPQCRARAKRLRKRWTDVGAKPPASAGDAKDIERIQADLLSGSLGEDVRDLLLADGSLAIQLFGRKALTQMIDSHRSGLENHLQTLGFLITFERWQAQLRVARARAL